MNADFMLANYERVVDAPDAIPQLRRLILDLAVRGKLVSQHPENESALGLLASRRSQRAKGGQLDEVPVAERPFSVPPGWTWVRFGSVHELIRGVTYTASDVSETPAAGYLPILRANNIGSALNFDQLVFVRKECISPAQMLRRGDYLVALSSGSKDLVGKAAFVAAEREAGFGAFCGVLRLVSSSLEAFVGVFLSSRLYRDAISEGSRGIGINNLKRETLSNLPFPLPPIGEQHRIASRVDELMALCDRLEVAREKREALRNGLAAASLARLNAADLNSLKSDVDFVLDNLAAFTTRTDQVKQLRRTIVNLGVRGRLVPHDPRDEPASELLMRIEAEKARLVKAGEIRRRKRPSPAQAQDALGARIPGWIWVRLGDVSTLITKGSTPTSYGHSYTSEGVNFIKVETITNGLLLRDNVRSFISTETHDFLARSQLAAGDILFSIAGSIGTCAVVTDQILPANTNQALAIIRGTQTVFSSDFLLRCLQSSLANSVLAKARGGAMNNVSLEDINNIVLPAPPLAEQRRIVAKIDELAALCDRLEERVIDAIVTRSALLRTMVADAVAAA